LIKAAAGGGGKGMHTVRSPDDLGPAVAIARREAQNAFGNSTVFVERYIENARHIEVQVIADDYDHLVHCFERECSIQRRHQKVIEEAPSPSINAEQRSNLTSAALAAIAAVGYRNVGTVEFVVEPNGNFWFLEVNTRLQVEHPVTEEVTGIDLVREQLRIAEGKPISFGQEDLLLNGHAIEARLYAEDPAHDYLPSPGHLLEWVPSVDPGARFESGVESGSEIGSEFDPMLAKVIVHSDSRTEAARRLAMVLEKTRIRGLTTNRDLLVTILRHPDFLEGRATTSFLSQTDLIIQDSYRQEEGEIFDAACALALLQAEERRKDALVLRSIPSGWTNGILPPQQANYLVDGQEVEVRYRSDRDGGYLVDFGDEEDRVTISQGQDGSVTCQRGGRLRRFNIFTSLGESWVQGSGRDLKLVSVDRFGVRSEPVAIGTLASPMPGRVSKVSVTVGDRVEMGQSLVTVEAMKMEHTMNSPYPGVVTEVYVQEDDQVTAGAPLVLIDEAGAR
jgi:acetyl/propionyl-CoA carboxylase alpha subunit